MIGRACLLASVAALALASGASAQTAADAPSDSNVVPPPASTGTPTSTQADSGKVAPSGDASGTPNTAQPDTEASKADEIVVTGVRASLRSAVGIKRNSAEIVDSIVAEDIGKLPDNNVAEALQRISGVQIQRNQGEGSSIAIRGLTQIRTELNGRSIFTAGSDRGVSFEDIPSELLAGVDIYKTPAADLVEGGIGGTVNLRTRRPFDFKGLEVSGTARGNYYDNAKKAEPQLSGLISDRWNTGIGEIGALVSVSYQKGAFRTDTDGTEPYYDRTDLFDLNGNGKVGDADDAILAPAGGGQFYETGHRQRLGINGVLQWEPTPGLDVYAEGNYSNYKFRQYTNEIYPYSHFGTLEGVPGTFSVFPGTNIMEAGTWRNVFIDATSYINFNDATTWQAAGGAKLTRDRFEVSTDLSYTHATASSNFTQLGLHAIAPEVRQDLGTRYPSLTVTGIDLTSPDSYQFDRTDVYLSQNTGSEFAARVDGEYKFDGALSAIKVGFRYADRKTSNASVSDYDTSISGLPLSMLPEAGQLAPHDDFLGQVGRGDTATLPVYLSPPESLLTNFDQVRQAFGMPLGDPAFDPLSEYNLSEKTYAGYLMATFKADALPVPISGNIGVRAVRTEESVNGFEQLEDGSAAPINANSSYTSVLPALNLRADFTQKLALRFSASKALTRPSFNNLSPSITLDYTFRTGSAGNPALKPLKADQLDTSLEWYFKPGSIAYLAGFYKWVNGFIQTTTTAEAAYNNFEITRPVNGRNGKIRGFEAGVQTFFDFLPSPLDGFGVQANYTFVDSRAPSPVAEQTVPLEGLSRNSYNLVGIFEKYGISARVAYNWRDAYVQTTQGAGSGSLPIYDRGGGELDASIGYDINKHMTITVDAVNITRLVDYTYFGTRLEPRAVNVPDRRFGVTLRASL